MIAQPSPTPDVVEQEAGHGSRRLVTAALGRPVLLWSGYLAFVTVLAVAARRLVPEVLAGPHGVSPLQVMLQVVITLAVVPFAAAVGGRRLGLTTGLRREHLPVLTFPLTTVAVGFLGGLRELPAATVVLALASVALAGLGEELAFRGVLLHTLLPRGPVRAVVVSSALFGLLHLANVALGASWQTTALQVVFAAMAGAGYAAMRLRTGSLWPPMLLHAAYDATFRLAEVPPGSAFQYTIFLLHGVGWALYAVVVLRHHTEDDRRDARGWLARLGRESTYVLLALPVTLVSGTVLLSGVALAAALAVTVAGPPLLAGTLMLATGLAGVERRRLDARGTTWVRMLSSDGGSAPGWHRTIRDRQAWMAWVHGVGSLPLATITWSVVVVWWCGAVGGLTSWAWGRLLPSADAGTTERELLGLTVSETALSLALGLLLATTLPTVVHGCAALHVRWARTTLLTGAGSAPEKPRHDVLVDQHVAAAERLPS